MWDKSRKLKGFSLDRFNSLAWVKLENILAFNKGQKISWIPFLYKHWFAFLKKPCIRYKTCIPTYIKLQKVTLWNKLHYLFNASENITTKKGEEINRQKLMQKQINNNTNWKIKVNIYPSTVSVTLYWQKINI